MDDDRLRVGGRTSGRVMIRALGALAATLAINGSVIAQCEQAQLLPSDAPAQDRFGIAVDVSGDSAIVGSWLDDERANDAGAVYFFETESWTQRQKVTIIGTAESDQFGVSVSIRGGLAVAGAWLDDENGEDAGAAYVLRRAGDIWIPEQKLTASDGAAGDRFGGAVAIDGEVVVVGSAFDDDAGSATGSAYVFRFVAGQWTEERKLKADDDDGGDQFGVSLAIDGDAVAVGAPGTDDNGTESGSVYVFRFADGIWTQEQKLQPIDGGVFDFFGNHVDISGDSVVAGAVFDDPQGLDSGAAYVFRFDGVAWSQEQKLLPNNGSGGDRFGSEVAIDGDVIIAGAPRQDSLGDDAGAAYVFRRDGVVWIQADKVTASDGEAGDEFGGAITVHGDIGIIGAALDDQAGPDTGSAYVYIGLVGTDCNENGDSDSCDIANGTSHDDEGDGIPDECQCPQDIDDSGEVDFADLLLVIAAWGPCFDCPEDLDENGLVDFADVIILLTAWGICEDP